MKFLLIIALLTLAGCTLDLIVEETPEFQVYSQGWSDGWMFLYDEVGRDYFQTDGCINSFLQKFDMPTVGQQVWSSEIQFRKMTEYQRGAWDAYQFMIRNW